MRVLTGLMVGIWAVLGAGGLATAALYDRGGGLIYDDGLVITWLQDADYANTSGYVASLPLSDDRNGRMHWGEAMAWAESLEYGGYDDWRLPEVGEMDFMYHTNGVTGSNMSPFQNLKPNSYASATVYNDDQIYDFNFRNGIQNTPGKTTWFYAWAVRDGDSPAPVPVPATMLLLGSGLVGLGALRKKMR